MITVLLFFGCGCHRATEVQHAEANYPAMPNSVLDRVDAVLVDVLKNRTLDADVQAAWQVLHGILAFGDQFVITNEGKQNSAIPYLLRGGQLEGWQLRPGDRLEGNRVGVKSLMQQGSFSGEGHHDQWLAVLSQAGLALDTEIKLQDSTHSMGDFLAQAMNDVPYNEQREYSWTLIAITQYLPTSATWTAADGMTWSVEQLLQHEIDQGLVSGTCGGTHRLIGISMAINRHLKENSNGINTDGGVWQNASDILRSSAETARGYQNSDGSFSTNYFSRPGISSDNAQVLATTGHTLEFLALTLPTEELKQPWISAAVNRLCEVLEASRSLPLECGALYHAVHGLAVFQEKISDEQ